MWLAELRELSTHCEFGNYSKQALLDCLVCGMISESTQRKLLNLRDLTFARAFEIAEDMEAAESNIQQLHQGSDVALHSVTQSCYRC